MPKLSRLKTLIVSLIVTFAAIAVRCPAQADLDSVRAHADQGDPEALNALGNAYANGQGVPVDYAAALKFYRQAAATGYAPAMFGLGLLYEQGKGVKADLAEAFRNYLAAAEQGYAPAQFNVGNMYASGQGVAVDDLEAVLWLRQAANKGLASAQYNLGIAYELGRGVAKDEAEAQKWYLAAVNQGHLRAMYNLALMLEDGRGSTPNPAGAAKLYRIAALQGYAPAQNNLGIMLESGRGVGTPNLAEAYAWLSLAVQNGIKPAARDLLATKLSPAQLAAGTNALASLRGQIEGRIAPAATAAGAANALPVAEAATVDRTEVAEIRAENARYLSELRSLQASKDDLTQRLAVAEGAMKDSISAPAAQDLRAQLDGVQREAANLKAADEAAQAQLAAAQNRLAKAESQAQAADTGAAADRTALAKLRDQNTQDLLRLQSLQDARDDLSRRLAAADAAAHAPPAQPKAPDLRGDVDRLRKEVADLRTANAAAQARLAAAQAQAATRAAIPAPPVPAPASAEPSGALADAQARIQSLQTENARLDEEVKDGIIRLSALEQQQGNTGSTNGNPPSSEGALAPLPAAASKIAELNRSLGQLQAANARLMAENQRLTDSARSGPSPETARSLADALRERNALAGEKASLEARMAGMTAKLGAVASETAQESNLKSDLAATRMELVAARRATEELRAQADADKDAAVSRNRQLAAQLAEARKTFSNAQTQVANADQAGRTQAQAETEQAREALVASQREIAALHAEHAKLQEEAESSRVQLQRQISALTSENRKLAAEQERQGPASPNAKSDGAALDNLKEQNDELQKDLEVAKQSAAAAFASEQATLRAAPEAAAMRLEMRTLQEQVDHLEGRRADDQKVSASEIAALAKQLEIARSTNLSLADANRSLVEMKGNENATLKTELDALESKARELTAARDKTTGENSALSGAIAQLRQSAEKSQGEIAQFRERTSSAAATVAALTGQVSLSSKSASDQAAKAAELAAANQLLQGKVKSLESSLSAQHDDATRQWAGAQAELNSLKVKLAAADQAAAGLKAKLAANDLSASDQNARTNDLAAANGQLRMEASGIGAERDRLALQNAALVQQIAQLRRVNSDAGAQRDASLRQLAATQDELAGLKAKLAADDKTGAEGAAQLDAANRELASVRRDVSALREQLASGEKAVAEQSASTKDLSAANERLQTQAKDLAAQIEGLRAENSRVAQARQETEAGRAQAQADAEQERGALAAVQARDTVAENTAKQASGQLDAATRQLAASQREIASLQAEHARLQDAAASAERDRNAIAARLRFAQSTLDQIASAARLINNGGGSFPTATPANPASASAVPSAPAPSSAQEPRFHVVQEGDSLTRISMRYYGTANRWQDIYDANRDALQGQNTLQPGQRLKIP